MNPLLAYGIASGIGSLASGLMNTGLGYNQSKGLMDYQYQLQQQAIDKANLFNSPAEQMKRLAQAHLSPNLVYGSGVDGNQAQAASPSMVNRSGQIQNPLQDLGTAYLQSKQLQMQEIQTRNAAFESRERQKNIAADTLVKLDNHDFLSKSLKSRIEHSAQKLALDVARTGTEYQRSNNLRIAANNLVEQGNLLAEKIGLTKEQALTEVVKRKFLESGRQLNNAKAREAAAMVNFIAKGSALRGLQYDIQSTAYDAVKVYQEWKAAHPKTALTLDMVKEILGMGQDIANIAGKFYVP